MPYRYICDVLEEMRKCNEHRNYSLLLSLIEEAQTLANRMEAALGEKKDHTHWHDEAKKKKTKSEEADKELKELNKRVEEKKKELQRLKSKTDRLRKEEEE